MKVFHILAVLAFIALTPVVSAQKYTLSGKVLDQSDHSPLPGANVVVKNSEGKVVEGVITDEKGQFTTGSLERGISYTITISFIGYQTLEKSIGAGGKLRDLGTLFLSEKPSELQEVSVEGKLPLATQEGDTVVYNADAYKTNPDADAQDLAKKMPGVEVDNGTIKAQGEQVTKVTVDGRPVFDQDPMLALRSLPASVVEKIQVFDEQSEQSRFTGFDDGQTTKTMNIVTRRSMRNGSFGKIYGGIGSDNRYNGGASVNYFKGNNRISLIGMANNVNQQNFSSEDILGMTSSGGRSGGGFRGGRGGGGYGGGGRGGAGGYSGDRNNFMVGQQPGISKTQALGLNYSGKWGKKIEVTGSYFINHSSNANSQKTVQNFFSTGTDAPYYEEQNTSTSNNLNHRLNMRLTYNIDSSNSILIIPRLSLQDNTSTSDILSKSLQGSDLLNTTVNALNSGLSGYNFSNDVLYRHRFSKAGRTISLDVNAGMNDNQGNTKQKSESIYYADSASNDILNQNTHSVTSGASYRTRLAYTEPLGSKSILMITAGNSFSHNDADKQTFNYEEGTGEYSYRDTALSNVYKSTYTTTEAGTNYRYRNNKMMLMAGLNYQVAQLKSDERFPAEDRIKHNFTSVLPQFMLRYDFSKSVNLRLFYRTMTDAPSVSQLQNVIDNSNPVQLSTGNPDLRQSYQHNLFMRLSAVNTARASTLFVLAGGGIGTDYVVNSTFLAATDTVLADGTELKSGTRLVRPVNADGYRNFRVFGSYGVPIKAIKTNLNFNGAWTYSRTPGVINGLTSFTNSHSFSLGVVLASNISERVDFTVSSSSSYSLAENSVRPEMDNTYFYQRSELDLNLIIWKGIVFTNQVQHQYYTGLSADFNESYFLWNMGIGKKVFKDQLGEFKLSVFDLLNQNKSISRNVTELYIEDTKTDVLKQYVMLSFTYNLRKFGAPPPPVEERPENWRGRPDDR